MRRRVFLLFMLASVISFAGLDEVRCCADLNGCVVQTQSGGGNPPNPPPSWAPRNDGNSLPHSPILAISVSLMPSVRNWDPAWLMQYENAFGYWNEYLSRLTFVNIEPGGINPVVWIVREGSDDDAFVNRVVSEAGGGSFGVDVNCAPHRNAWATMYSAKWDTSAGHDHRTFQKICLWQHETAPGSGVFIPNAPKETDAGGWHRWWLTLTHELGHVLSLDDGLSNPSPCVMRSGYSMLFPCFEEQYWVQSHYGY